MERVDARLDASPISDDLILPSGDIIRGRFFLGHREIELRDGSIAALEISFSGPATSEVLRLVENELVRYRGVAYRFVRRLPNRGDETGRVVLELGTLR